MEHADSHSTNFAHSSPRANTLLLLDPARIRLGKERPGWLLLTDEDGEERRVKPVRTFPLTDPDHFISLLDEDESDVGIIEEPMGLDTESLENLHTQLEQTYFLPVVQKIVRVTEDFGVYRWEVETNKGPRTFEVRGRDDVRIVANGHVLIRDIDGNRYHILSLSRLEPESRTQIDLLL